MYRQRARNITKTTHFLISISLLMIAVGLVRYARAEDAPKSAPPTIEELQKESAEKDETIKWLTDMLNTMASKSEACSMERQANEKLQQLQIEFQKKK